MKRLPGLLLLWTVGVIPLLMRDGALDRFEEPKALALLVAAALAAALAARLGVVPGGPARLPVLGLLAAGAIATAASPLPGTALWGEDLSYQGWWRWLALAALGLAWPGWLGSAPARRKAAAAAVLSLVLVAAGALLELAAPPGPAGARAVSTAGNALYLGLTLAPGVPLALGLAAASGRPGPRFGWIGAAAVILAGLVASGSRSALVGALAGAAVFLVARRRDPSVRRLAGPAGAALLLASAIASVVSPPDRNPWPLLAARLAEAARGADDRPAIWASAARLLRRSPLAGSGPDTFAALQPGVQTAALWTAHWQITPEKAHDELLQLAVTAGLPAAGLGVWLLAVLARLARGPSAGVDAAAGPALLALGLPASFGYTTAASQAAGLLLAALLLARGGPPGRRSRWAACGWTLAGVLLAGAGVLALRDALGGSELAAWLVTGRGLPAARAAGGPYGERWFRTGFLVESRARAGDPSATARLRDLADVYEAGLAASPRSAPGWADLARTRLREGRVDEAFRLYDRARELDPWNATLALERAQALDAAGRTADALAALGDLIAAYPDAAEALGYRGYLELRRGHARAAAASLREALARDWHGDDAARRAAEGNLAAALATTVQ